MILPEVWQADVEKVSFITNEGVPAAAEVFNHYGDKRLGRWKECWAAGTVTGAFDRSGTNLVRTSSGRSLQRFMMIHGPVWVVSVLWR